MSTMVSTGTRTKAIGVVVPVHNEEDLLGEALEAIEHAVSRVIPQGVECRSIIVLDSCSDSSESIAKRWARHLAGPHRAAVVSCLSSSVGSARRAGSTELLHTWADIEPRHIWLATTDADSRVPPTWLCAQLDAHEAGNDVWSGRIAVEDWSGHQLATAVNWGKAYDDETSPIHGANLGFNAQWYVDVGGFAAVVTGEDRALYKAIVDSGGLAYHDSEVKVITSGRRQARAPMGFSHALTSIDVGLRSATALP